MLQPVIELLVGIPSVVYGFIGLTVLVPFIAQFKSSGTGHSLLAGTIVLSVMILPTITSISADAMASLPKSLERVLTRLVRQDGRRSEKYLCLRLFQH